MIDLKLIESQDGGDLVFNGNDLEVVTGIQNMPYLALFGGNVGGSTKEVMEGEQYIDWWGNTLLFNQFPEFQANSETEFVIDNTVLSSQGRLIIQQTIEKDLSFMTSFSEVYVNARVISDNRLAIEIKINEPSNSNSNEFTYIWDGTKNQLIEK